MDGRTNIHLNAAVVTMSCSAQAGLTKEDICSSYFSSN